ncbi:hypothetical protein [Synechococcus sp. MIT S1220]
MSLATEVRTASVEAMTGAVNKQWQGGNLRLRRMDGDDQSTAD